jgi:TPR repeat protein
VNYRAADAMGDAEGSRELGILLVKTGDLGGARSALERSRDRGSASGALALGFFLASNTSDIDRAEEAFRKAADMGHPKGAINVADLVEEQRGDTEQARHFRRIALEKARQRRALMEDLEGPDYLEELQRYVNKSESPARAAVTSPGGASGGSCVLLLAALVAMAFGVAGTVWRLSSTAPRRARQVRRSLDLRN